MWETDIGYFGVPNGEQVKPSRLEVATSPGLRLDLRPSRLYAASSVCSNFLYSILTLERVYVHVFRQQ
jgi:hypothetical protein